MLKGDCNKCVHGDMPEDSRVCVECGISRIHYTPIKKEDTRMAKENEALLMLMTLMNAKNIDVRKKAMLLQSYIAQYGAVPDEYGEQVRAALEADNG